jgi:diadenosine tetraphosphate (Ap4A) HIT family hydrolase
MMNKKPCLFCTWTEDLERVQNQLKKHAEDISIFDVAENCPEDTNKPWKTQFLAANEHFFAILSRDAKTKGHTLIISRKHFSGIAAESLSQQQNEYKIDFFNFVTTFAQKIAFLTEDLDFPKVFVMSVCEHWTDEELESRGCKFHTEHFHVHLIPRSKELRGQLPEYCPESLFIRPDKRVKENELKDLRNKILRSDL